MPELEVQPGAILGGKYRVERVLGRGGMGVVVEATQLDLERRVALKFLRHAVLPEKGVALTRFEREARNVARLRGPHIVQVYDVGRLEHGEPFIVMELLTGEDLKAVLDREQRVPIATAVEYVAQTCEAMAEAHVAGVVHRDLKPANLFVARRADGRPLVKVLDFGISKLMSETTSLNLTSGALGSPLYMSPEQLTSAQRVDYRTDIWSLGAILYELLTGATAFEADGLPQVCTRIMVGRPDPMNRPGVEIPQPLEDAVLRCLSRQPEERFLTVADLAMALLPFARKGAGASVETAVRIVQASNLRHDGLPRSFDSLPPAPEPTPRVGALDATVRTDAPFTQPLPLNAIATVQTQNVGGALADTKLAAGGDTLLAAGVTREGVAGVTQGELKPLVYPAGSAAPEPGSRWKALLFGGVALVLTSGALLFATQLDDEPEPRREDPAPASSASGPPAALSAVDMATPPSPSSALLGVDPALPTEPSAAAPAPKRLPPPPRKVRPKPTEPSTDDMLKHR